MIANKIIKVGKTKWDRCTRNGSVRIGNKNLLFHTFSPLLQSFQDLTTYLEALKSFPNQLSNAKMMTFRIVESDKTITTLMEKANSKQLNLYGQHSYQFEKDVVESIPILIDPCMDYTWYKQHREELSQIPALPKELRNLISSLIRIDKQEQIKKMSKVEAFQKQKKTYEDFWHGLLTDPKKLADVVTRMLELQNALGADVGLPPVPPIYSPKLLDVAKQINKISKAVWTGENCATYLVLTPEIMHSEGQIKPILDYLKNVDSKFIVIKIKNLELDKVSYVYERDMFKKILETVNGIKKYKNDDRVFVMLEAGLQFYPAMAGGFDVVSTSLRALDKDGAFGRYVNEGNGGWYDPKYLVVRSFQDVKKMFDLNGGLPCQCPVCSKMKKIGKRNEWNQKRREHYIYSASYLSQEISNFVEQQRVELAIEKLSKSALSNFKRLLPFVS